MYNDSICSILKRFNIHGFRAFAVGSCVYKLLLGEAPVSCTIVTSASAKQIKNLFKSAVSRSVNQYITISELGIICYIFPILSFESTSNKDLYIYLAASEFTCSAVALSHTGELVDFFGGEADIKNGIISSISNAFGLFKKKPEKMLYAIRLAADSGFALSENVKAAMRACAPLIKTIERDFVLSSLTNILMSHHPDFIRIMHETQLLQYILPQLDKCFGEPQKNKYHIYDVGEHIMHTLTSIRCNETLRWAALLHDIGKPYCSSRDSNGTIHFYGHHKESALIAEEFLNKFHMPAEKSEDIITLIEYHDVRIENSVPAVKHIMSKLDYNLFLMLLELQLADNSAKNPDFLADKAQRLQITRDIGQKIFESGEPYRISDLVIGSRDLINMKCRAGRKIGDTLKALLDEVIANPALNNRTYLLRRARKIIESKECPGRK